LFFVFPCPFHGAVCATAANWALSSCNALFGTMLDPGDLFFPLLSAAFFFFVTVVLEFPLGGFFFFFFFGRLLAQCPLFFLAVRAWWETGDFWTHCLFFSDRSRFWAAFSQPFPPLILFCLLNSPVILVLAFLKTLEGPLSKPSFPQSWVLFFSFFSHLSVLIEFVIVSFTFACGEDTEPPPTPFVFVHRSLKVRLSPARSLLSP